jgi:oligopeptide transport system substrate-binding protein
VGLQVKWLALLLLLCSCGSSEVRPIRLNLFAEPSCIDPRRAADVSAATVCSMLYEGLTRMGPEGAELALAESIEAEGHRYTIRLRKSLWSDGELVTAHHFVESWNSSLDPSFPSEHAYLLSPLKHFHALDDQTIELELEHPVPNLLTLLSNPQFFPLHGDATNGPFRLVTWEHGKQLQLARNPTFWDAERVEIDKLELVVVESELTELDMFQQGSLDWAGSPLSVIPYDARPNLPLHSFPTAEVYWYKFNTRAFPFHNQKMRQAFALAIDREALASHLSQGTLQPATGVVPATLWKDAPKRGQPGSAEALFNEGLEELGLTAEQMPRIVLSFNATDDHMKIAQAVQQNWQETFGVQVVLQVQDWAVHLSKLKNRDYMVARHSWQAEQLDPIDLLNPFRDANDTGWQNAEFRHLLSQAERKPQRREQLLQQAEALLLEEAPVTPLFFVTQYSVCNPALEGVVLSPHGRLDLSWATTCK